MDYRKLDDSAWPEDVLVGGQYHGVVTFTDEAYILVALNNWRDDVLATEMANGSMSQEDVVEDAAATGILHHSDMGVPDPVQFTVGDQIAVRVKEVTQDGFSFEFSEAIDVTRNQIADETGPGYGKTPPWEQDDEPFECEECGETFETGSELGGHMGTHADEGTFECSVCGETYDTPSGLGGHSKAHPDQEVYNAAAEDAPDEPDTPTLGEPTPGSLRDVYGDGSGATLDDYETLDGTVEETKEQEATIDERNSLTGESIKYGSKLIPSGDSILVVKLQEWNPDQEKAFTKEAVYADSWEAAFEAVMAYFPDDPHVRKMNVGPMLFYEDHDDDEMYLRAAIDQKDLMVKP